MKCSVNCYLLILFLLELNSYSCLIFYNDDDSQTLFLNPNQTESISIISSSKNVEFSLISVHSQINNITLSYDDPTKQLLKRNRKINGLNVGLVVFFDNNYPKRSYLYLRNENKLKFRVFIKISQFDGYFPIPGGCNLEFPVLISPFLRLQTNELNLILDFQKASLGSNFLILKDKQDCDFSDNKLTYEIYSYYLKENDYSEHEYFLALKRMSRVDLIETYGTKLENQFYQPKTRLKILAYRGKGVVYSVVVSFLNFKTAYTPIVSYDCDLKDSNSCRTYRNYFELIYYLVFGLLGLIVCLDSSKCTKLQILYFGFLIGSSLSYVLASRYPQINLINNIYATVSIGGLLFGSMWFAIWLQYSSIKIALILSGTHFGFLLISIILSFDLYQFKYSIIYGIFIILAFVLIPILSIFIDNHKLNTFCCSVTGSYMFVISIEQFFSGSLVYIALNTINTIIYNDLFLMQSNLPFQAIDYFSSFLWFILLGISLFLNLFTNLDISIFKSILNSFRTLFNSFKLLFKKSQIKKYEEIETIDNKDEDISKYNELSRSIIGSLNNLDKENEFCNTSFNSNSKYSSPLIKRKINSSSIKIDLPSPNLSRCSSRQCSSSSQCSTPRMNRIRLDHLDYATNQLNSPNNLLKNVVIQNAKYSTDKEKF